MSNKKNSHSFHIPVMGLAFTIDSPIRVAQYGISSTVSITDDDLIEKMRAFYSEKFSIPYQEITQKFQESQHYLHLAFVLFGLGIITGLGIIIINLINTFHQKNLKNI